MEIFDRWGSLLYRAENYKNDWEGTFKGRQLPVDTYFYTVQFGSDQKPKKGTVTIIR